MFDKIRIDTTYLNLVNGSWISSKTKDTIEILSPSSGKLVGRIQAMNKDEADEVIKYSKASEKLWAETPMNQRAAILHKAASLLEENVDELSLILQQEIAKDCESSKSEVKRTADFIRFTADEGKHMEGETIAADSFPGFGKNKLSFVTRVPLGTVLAISPFNYPINLSASKIAPALMAGNCVVLKPPTQGAISALHLVQAFHKAGVPKGVISTITGKASEIGDYIVTHKDINFINFTGSTEVGRHLAEIAGMVPMLLELGGKDAAIVLKDADLAEAAHQIVAGAFSYSGQRCTAIKRVIALECIAHELAQYMKQEVEKLKIGMPEEGAAITPLIDSKSGDFVMELIEDAREKGAKLLTGGTRRDSLIYPTLFDFVTPKMRLAWEEPFGPVLPILRVHSIDEAINLANESRYGLQSSVFTKNIDDAFYVANKLQVGTVQINSKSERGPDHFPFLGIKSSGMGTQGIRYSIEAMSRPKAIVLTVQ